MTPGECLKRAAAFLDQIHAETILSKGRADYPRDVIEGIAALKRGVVGLGTAEIKERPDGMLEQWAREEAEEAHYKALVGMTRGVAGVASGRESAASAFRNAAARVQEIYAGAAVQTDDVVAVGELYDSLAPLLDSLAAEAAPAQAEPIAPETEPANIAMIYDGDEKRLYDGIIGTLVSQHTWKRADMSAYAAEIIRDRRAFFAPESTPAKETHWQTPFFKFDPRTGMKVDQPIRAQEFRDYHGRDAWLFNPWTGTARHVSDIGSDVLGHLIVPPGVKA